MQLPERFETLPRGPAQVARRAVIERHFQPAKDSITSPMAVDIEESPQQKPSCLGQSLRVYPLRSAGLSRRAL